MARSVNEFVRVLIEAVAIVLAVKPSHQPAACVKAPAASPGGGAGISTLARVWWWPSPSRLVLAVTFLAMCVLGHRAAARCR